MKLHVFNLLRRSLSFSVPAVALTLTTGCTAAFTPIVGTRSEPASEQSSTPAPENGAPAAPDRRLWSRLRVLMNTNGGYIEKHNLERDLAIEFHLEKQLDEGALRIFQANGDADWPFVATLSQTSKDFVMPAPYPSGVQSTLSVRFPPVSIEPITLKSCLKVDDIGSNLLADGWKGPWVSNHPLVFNDYSKGPASVSVYFGDGRCVSEIKILGIQNPPPN